MWDTIVQGGVTVDKEKIWRETAKQAAKEDPSSSFVGAACPKCWLPIPIGYGTPDSTVCQCGHTTTAEEVLSAHGLSGLIGWLKPGSGLPRASKEVRHD